jgi:methyl-accepting chemotaxis protein
VNLDNFKKFTRLASIFGLLITIVFSIVTASLLQMGTLHRTTTEINDDWLPSVEVANKLNTATANFRIAQLQHVLSSNSSNMASIEKPY